MEEIFNLIRNSGISVGFEGSLAESLGTAFGLKPKDYMELGEEDLNNPSRKSLINSRRNIKMAIECRVDELLHLFGILNMSRKQDWTFSRKMDFLKDVGLISSRILKKVNFLRTKAEHNYGIPNIEEVEELLEGAALFLAYTEKYVDRTYGTLIVEGEKVTTFSGINFYYPQAKIDLISKDSKFKILYSEEMDSKKSAEITLLNWEGYLALLKFWIKAVQNN